MAQPDPPTPTSTIGPEPRLEPLQATLAAVLWAALGWFPWQGLLPSPWARTALAFAWFAIPGCLFVELLTARRLAIAGTFPVGFALSVAGAGVLGLVGAIVGAPFGWIALAFSILGARVVFLWFRRPKPPAPPRSALDRLALGLGLGVLLLGARLAFDPGVGSADDLTGFARTTYFRFGPGLGFGEHLFDSGERIAPRYWIAYWPLTKALLSFAANVEPLPFTTLYLPPFLGALALSATYALARACRLSEAWAWVASALQLAACAWLSHDSALPGFVLWRRITQDKVAAAAILCPLFLAGVARLVRRDERSTWITTALIGVALLLTHGEALGFTALYAGAFLVFGGLFTERWRTALAVLALCGALVAPAIALRFADHPMNDRIRSYAGARPGGERRGQEPDTSPFYGLKLERVEHGPYVLLAVAALVSLRRKRRPAENLCLGAAAVLTFVLVPITGWIVGRIVTPPHLGRVPWFCPFGVALVVLFPRSLERLRARGARSASRASSGWIETALIPLVAGFALVPLRDPPATLARGLDPPRGWDRRLESWRPLDLHVTYADLARAGAFLDEADENVTVCGDRLTNDLLPAVSTRARLFVYRAPIQTVIHGSVSHDEANRRQRDWLDTVVPARPTSPAERAEILRRRGVRYVVLSEQPEWAVELVEDDPGVDAVFHSGRLVVLAIEPARATE